MGITEHVMSSKDNKWRTPLDLAQEVRGVFGGNIELDPCTEPGNHLRAIHYYTERDDGLMLPWVDGTWCNPPYDQMRDWLEKAEYEASLGASIGFLTSVARTEQAYFQRFVRHATCTQWLNSKLRHSEGQPAMLASFVHWFNVPPEVVNREMGWRGLITVAWR